MTDEGLPLAYVAGPLFDEGERWWIESIEELVAGAGFTTFLPHRDNPPKDEHNTGFIFENNRNGIDACDIIVANLNGITTDDGTAWELGYGSAKAKYQIGIFTDWRSRFGGDNEVVNLMMQESLDVLVRSPEELRLALTTWVANVS